MSTALVEMAFQAVIARGRLRINQIVTGVADCRVSLIGKAMEIKIALVQPGGGVKARARGVA